MVCDIEENMPPDEVTEWVAYFSIKDARMERERKKLELRNKNKNR